MKQSQLKSLGAILLLLFCFLTFNTVTANASANDDFVIENHVLVKYTGSDSIVTIPENVTVIGENAFYRNDTMTEVIIPSGVTEIKNSAFQFCSKLKSVSLPDTLTTIGEMSFSSCGSLKNITIPESVTTIENRAFYNNASLTEVVLPSGIKNIESNVFMDCTSLTSVTLPNSLTTIGSGFFNGCSSLKTIIIPDSVTTISDYAFCNCTSLTSISLPGSITTIGIDAFSNCSSLTSISIPDSVTEIACYAFSHCTKLSSIKLPDSLTEINDAVFYGCSSLTNISIPDSVTSIGIYTFAYTSIGEITIPANVTYIDSYAFRDCTKLVTIHLAKENTSYRLYNSVLYSKDLSSLVILPNGLSGTVKLSSQVNDLSGLYVNTSSKVTAYTIKNGVNYISKDGILYSKDGKTLILSPQGRTKSVTVPSTVTKIGSQAFQNCSKIKSINILYGTKKLDYKAFYGCSSLKSITIPDSVTWIGESAFSLCDNLKSITIPSSVTKLGFQGDEFYGYDFYDAWESCEDGEDELYYSRKDTTITIICDKNSLLYKKLDGEVPCFAELYCNATWKTASTVTVKFNANSGKVKTSSKSVIKNTTYGSLPSPTRAGYTFKGWYTKKTGGTKVTSNTKCTSSRTLYAHWKKITVSKAKISKVSSTKKGQIAINVKTQSGVDGYRIYYSTSKSFKNAKYVSGPNPAKTIKSLTSKKTYYIRVRVYKIDSCGKKVYGAYSSISKVKVVK